MLAVRDGAALLQAASFAGVPAIRIGEAQSSHGGSGGDLTLPDGATMSLAELRRAHEDFFPAWMNRPAAT